MIGNMDVVEYTTYTTGKRAEELTGEQHDENGTIHTLFHHVD